MAGPPPADKQGLVCMLHVSKDMDEEILYALHIMQCKTNGPSKMYVAPLAEIISKICGNVLQDLWKFGREKNLQELLE